MDKGLLNNRYRLVEMVGSGGMAVVFKGVDTLLHRPVAIKILREAYADDDTFLSRFQQEARSAAGLDHPNVVTVYDVGRDGDRHYIVMEYVDGEDLKTCIRRKGRLTVAEAVDIATQVASGVGHAHKAGIIHCDVKPQNVLVTEEGVAKVADFGIARALSESGLTDSDVVWGSPLYLAPEQAAGERPTPASDVYSIGVTLYEMLAGVPPFQAEKPAALALKHVQEDPPPLSEYNAYVPSQLEWIVRKLLSKEPSARYRTAEQLALVLREYQARVSQATGLYQVPNEVSASRETRTDTRSAADDDAEPEWLTWVLGVIAAIAVIGLIPLWAGVYLAWTRASATPVAPPMATVTPTVAMVVVPDVEGQPWEEARDELEELGLRFELEEEQNSTAPEGIIIRQEPPPDDRVPIDSMVRLYIAGPPETVEVPGVVDVPVELAREWLESAGLQIAETVIWSTEPISTVVSQMPDRGTEIQAGEVVTLTVSGGTSVPIEIGANLNHMIELDQVELLQARFRPGDILGVNLRWQTMAAMDTRYVVFIHLIGPDGDLVAQEDVEPLQGAQPTDTWVPGMSLWDMHQVTIPQGAAPGTYELRTGMYPQGRPENRLPVVDRGQTTTVLNSLLIAEIEVVRP